jgi:Cu/Zn superoxide dismutase
MRIRHALVLAFAGSIAVACGPRDDTDTAPGLLPGDDMTTTQQQDMVVARSDFQPTDQAEGLQVSGWAEFRQRGANWREDGLELRVHLMGLSEGDHGWHIHRGTCDSPGQVVLPISDMGDMSGVGGDLNAGADGMAEETVNIDRDRLVGLDLNQSHVINVHLRGGDNPGPAIACAAIQLDGAGMGTTYPGTTQPGAAPGTTPGTTQPGAAPGTTTPRY